MNPTQFRITFLTGESIDKSGFGFTEAAIKATADRINAGLQTGIECIYRHTNGRWVRVCGQGVISFDQL